MTAAIGPKIKNARTEKSSAGSNRRNGIIGNEGWIFAGIITVDKAAKLPKIAAPAKVMLLLVNRPSAILTTKDGHYASQLLNCTIMTILRKSHGVIELKP
jgi:hypothetical protein